MILSPKYYKNREINKFCKGKYMSRQKLLVKIENTSIKNDEGNLLSIVVSATVTVPMGASWAGHTLAIGQSPEASSADTAIAIPD